MERLTITITEVGMPKTTLDNMKHYMPCIPCRERAGIKYKDGQPYTEKFAYCDTCEVKMLFNKLKEYEDLEEQGLLLRLPCKVEDTVYEVQEIRKRIQPMQITTVKINRLGGICFEWELKDGIGIYQSLNGFSINQLGERVFLTKEEAEAKLEELRGAK